MHVKNWLVGVWVAVATCIFVAAYILKFGALQTSSDPGDWADFGTYISGTVGVASVLGTLVAVVRTLGQQQDLVESQRVMLEKQEEQIRLASIQLENEKKNREVELAYENVKSILPMMVEYLERYVAHKIEIPRELIYGYNKSSYGNSISKRKDMFRSPRVLCDMYQNGDERLKDEVESYVVSLMGPCTRIYAFLFKQLEVAPELFDASDCHLDKEFKENCYSAQFYLLCVMAYKTGVGDVGFCYKAKNLMFMRSIFSKSEPSFTTWFELGQMVRNNKISEVE